MGDDDRIMPELTQFMVDFHVRAKNQLGSKHIASTSYMTYIKGSNTGIMQISWQGIYETDWLKKNLYKTHLKKQVDSEHIQRLKNNGWIMATCPHYFGYQYRLHEDMVSGIKRFKAKGKK